MIQFCIIYYLSYKKGKSETRALPELHIYQEFPAMDIFHSVTVAVAPVCGDMIYEAAVCLEMNFRMLYR